MRVDAKIEVKSIVDVKVKGGQRGGLGRVRGGGAEQGQATR